MADYRESEVYAAEMQHIQRENESFRKSIEEVAEQLAEKATALEAKAVCHDKCSVPSPTQQSYGGQCWCMFCNK